MAMPLFPSPWPTVLEPRVSISGATLPGLRQAKSPVGGFACFLQNENLKIYKKFSLVGIKERPYPTLHIRDGSPSATLPSNPHSAPQGGDLGRLRCFNSPS